MPLVFDLPESNGALRQGEIIANLYEHQPTEPPVPVPEETPIPVESVRHPYVVVITADCDLLWDYTHRAEVREKGEPIANSRDDPRAIPHILMCDLFFQGEIRNSGRLPGGSSAMWARIRKNQEARYHYISASPIGNPQIGELPELVADFQKILTVPTHRLYEALEHPKITRLAVMPPVHVHSFMHRFYGFLSRVGVPE